MTGGGPLGGVVPHYESSLQQDVDRIHARLTDMGRRATRGLQDSLESFVHSNRQLAYSVMLRDTFIDALDQELDRLTLEFILRQQPVGIHLRFAAAVLKVNLFSYCVLQTVFRYSLINQAVPSPGPLRV